MCPIRSSSNRKHFDDDHINIIITELCFRAGVVVTWLVVGWFDGGGGRENKSSY